MGLPYTCGVFMMCSLLIPPVSFVAAAKWAHQGGLGARTASAKRAFSPGEDGSNYRPTSGGLGRRAGNHRQRERLHPGGGDPPLHSLWGRRAFGATGQAEAQQTAPLAQARARHSGRVRGECLRVSGRDTCWMRGCAHFLTKPTSGFLSPYHRGCAFHVAAQKGARGSECGAGGGSGAAGGIDPDFAANRRVNRPKAPEAGPTSLGNGRPAEAHTQAQTVASQTEVDSAGARRPKTDAVASWRPAVSLGVAS